MAYLDNFGGPQQLKQMSVEEMKVLAEEIRAAILKRNSLIGGHVGPNLGMVEATIALHYVFDSPKDKIVFDVSHQCYAHKILTGRQSGFTNPDDYGKISGYTAPQESEHDNFFVGHTSTSVSLATGLAKARDILGQKHNVIAVIGDGSLSGGEALEGLDFVGGELNSNLIVVVNDNEMSIAENHGGLYENLKLLRETNGKAELNLFRALGFDYMYVADGNDTAKLIEAFKQVKDYSKPIVVHIHTLKGKGYKFAEDYKERWHWNFPFNIKRGEVRINFPASSFEGLTTQYFMKRIENGEPVVMVAAGTPGVFGFTPEIRKKFGSHYVDVGIAEEHAVAMSSALAKGGAKPVFCVHSSFIQRTYDQLLQDLALNKNPALILVYWSGISGADATHLGCFDISMVSNIPNITYLSPANKAEYMAMLDWAMDKAEGPVVMRLPQGEPSDEDKFSGEVCLSEVVKAGEKVALIADGHQLNRAFEVAELLCKDGIAPTIISARVLSKVNVSLLEKLKVNHTVAVTLEDGILDGGYGEKVARFYGDSAMHVLTFGVAKEFTDRESLESILKRNRLLPEQIAEDIKKRL